jgi:2-polyprenyl-6-methoxyphenol hydroxylase-like FAD-dependent oxidoreductase
VSSSSGRDRRPAAGVALRRADAAVEIVERATTPDGGGAGLYLPGNALRALRRLGIDVGMSMPA